jgi:prepilin peptidase CpaA
MGAAGPWLTLAEVVALGVCLVACVFDVRTRRIPNALTFGAAAAGLVFHLAMGGIMGGLLSAGGWLLGVALFFPLFALRGMGAGDVKLVGALGAWLGVSKAIWVVLGSAIAGGVMGLAYALAIGYAKTAFWNIVGLLAYWRAVGLKPAPDLTLDRPDTPRLPYALPITVGTVVAVWFR